MDDWLSEIPVFLLTLLGMLAAVIDLKKKKNARVIYSCLILTFSGASFIMTLHKENEDSEELRKEFKNVISNTSHLLDTTERELEEQLNALARLNREIGSDLENTYKALEYQHVKTSNWQNKLFGLSKKNLLLSDRSLKNLNQASNAVVKVDSLQRINLNQTDSLLRNNNENLKMVNNALYELNTITKPLTKMRFFFKVHYNYEAVDNRLKFKHYVDSSNVNKLNGGWGKNSGKHFWFREKTILDKNSYRYIDLLPNSVPKERFYDVSFYRECDFDSLSLKALANLTGVKFYQSIAKSTFIKEIELEMHLIIKNPSKSLTIYDLVENYLVINFYDSPKINDILTVIYNQGEEDEEMFNFKITGYYIEPYLEIKYGKNFYFCRYLTDLDDFLMPETCFFRYIESRDSKALKVYLRKESSTSPSLQ